MTVKVKICGLNSASAVRAAARADFAGFVFYPPSPRSVSPATAAALAARLPKSVKRVALFVDPDDALLHRTLRHFRPDVIQLHGKETPGRVAAIRRMTGLKVVKAIPVEEARDLAAAQRYADVADGLIFDARPPRRHRALPGGNARSFDWSLLAGKRFALPWMLSGGLNQDNIGRALKVTKAPAIDVSSGVEDRPGRKNPFKIIGFMRIARAP